MKVTVAYSCEFYRTFFKIAIAGDRDLRIFNYNEIFTNSKTRVTPLSRTFDNLLLSWDFPTVKIDINLFLTNISKLDCNM